MIQDWKDKRVTVMGLGRFGGGVGVTRWLAEAGAKVVLTDKLPAEKLSASLKTIQDLDVELHLGRHERRDFCQTDLVVVNPAVREDSPFLQAARDAGVPLTTEINLFAQRCPARCVGVTGSVGKSTIAAMIGHVLSRTLSDRRVWLGGNIGRSLLDDLAAIQPEDIVVLELSSFQLQRTPAVAWSPHIAVITDITPNHIDWHGSFAAYRAAKMNVVRYQSPARDAIVSEDRAELKRSLDQTVGESSRLWRYGLDGEDLVAIAPPTSATDCAARPVRVRDGRPLPPGARSAGSRLRWENLELNVPGRHNRLNAAAALTVAHLLGVESAAAVSALASFAALPDRLERVAVRAGVTYYNDSKSTTPQAASTALRAIPTPLLIILGGYDKGSDLRPVAEVAAERAKFAACIGQTGGQLAELVRAGGGEAEVCGDLATAVDACRRHATPGDTVLLSPACASWDQFDDYRARGAMFTRLVAGGAAAAQ